MTSIPLELVIAFVALSLAGVLSWVLLTEGSYFGRHWVQRSYDWLAPWYEGKWKSDEYQSSALNQKLFLDPLLTATANHANAVVLDLACGTGRVSCLLLKQPLFQGTIEAVDFSEGMLNQFRKHLRKFNTEQQSRVRLQQADLTDWRCPSPESCDAILFLEAAELVPQLPKLLSEIHSALKPGGILITTQVGPKFRWLFPGRHQQGDSMSDLLERNGFAIDGVHGWRKRYDVIHATK